MNICFASYRTFQNGKMSEPFQESDPANIAYALGGDYLSYYTLRTLSDHALAKTLAGYDLIFVELNLTDIELSRRILKACATRAATYTEGHIGDYQRLSPAEHISFLDALNSAQINFIYWEKYAPFFRALTCKPIEYLPYPYLLQQARAQQVPLEQRSVRLAVPTGFAGATRNGLASLTVAKRLLGADQTTDLICWLEGDTFHEDVAAISHYVLGAPFTASRRRPQVRWRKWLIQKRLDYRKLLALKSRVLAVERHKLSDTSDGASRLKFLRRGNWTRFIKDLASARILIDLNNRETVGRTALDCAALGLACVSTERSDMHARLFPHTTLSSSWDVEGAYRLCEKLLRDRDFYQEVVSIARNEVEKYDCIHFRDRFHLLAAHHRLSIPSNA
jgi:hypothetical protein